MKTFLKLMLVTTIVLFASSCSDTLSTDDDPLLNDRIVYGHVTLAQTGDPVEDAKVIIYYYDDGWWHYAKDCGIPFSAEVYTDENGYYAVEYVSAASGKDGWVTASKEIGGYRYKGNTFFTYPYGTSTEQDVSISN